MTGKTEDKQSARVQTPLHLLQVLTRTLNEHLAEACSQAEADAQKALDKLEREHAKLQERLDQAQQKLANVDPEANGKTPDKLRGKVDELSTEMAALTQARSDAQDYIRQLQSDVRQTLRLAKGLDRIELQVSQAIEKRNDPTAAGKPTKRPPQRRSRNRKPAAPPAPTETEA